MLIDDKWFFFRCTVMEKPRVWDARTDYYSDRKRQLDLMNIDIYFINF